MKQRMGFTLENIENHLDVKTYAVKQRRVFITGDY